jgi:hypothetical protein
MAENDDLIVSGLTFICHKSGPEPAPSKRLEEIGRDQRTL